MTLRWGIIGPGAIAHNFADGLRECRSGVLAAIASRDNERLHRFGAQFGIAEANRFDSYAALAGSSTIDALYIATPHPFHAELAMMAMRAGKHVVCEKPAGLVAGEVIAMTEVAAQSKVFFMEGLMYRCHPQVARLVELVAEGAIGEVRHVAARFGFAAAFDPASRLFDKALAGGAILDVGGYPVSLARLVAGAASGRRFADPIAVEGVGTIGRSGVDETAFALLKFDCGITAECAAAIIWDMEYRAVVTGARGTIVLPNPWVPGRNAGPSDATIEITVDGRTRLERLEHPQQLFAFEAETASRAILDGALEAPAPAMSWADSIGNARTLDRWRHAVGYHLPGETAPPVRRLAHSVPVGLPAMPMRTIDGVDLPVSALVMGCDNLDTLAEGAIVWDAWMEAGGNAFDTGFVYGGGAHEAVLGCWLKARGVAGAAVVRAKGGHTPYCTPRAIAAQLGISLDRLQLDRAPIYIIHRDNPDVPVGEFVDMLTGLHDQGRIGVFGGSNWSIERFAEANAYAAANHRQPMRLLNNNLALAVMEKPVWPGCVTSNTPATLAYLRAHKVAHFSWSSQARGYFVPAALRTELSADTAPDVCFASADNAERRRRAELLANEKGVMAHNIATAWVLGESFPSFALIGPRSPGEIVSTMPGLAVALTTSERAWLNLEADAR